MPGVELEKAGKTDVPLAGAFAYWTDLWKRHAAALRDSAAAIRKGIRPNGRDLAHEGRWAVALMLQCLSLECLLKARWVQRRMAKTPEKDRPALISKGSPATSASTTSQSS